MRITCLNYFNTALITDTFKYVRVVERSVLVVLQL